VFLDAAMRLFRKRIIVPQMQMDIDIINN